MSYKVFELASFFVLVGVFELAERRWPLRAHDRAASRRVDLFALAVLFVSFMAARRGLELAFAGVELGDLAPVAWARALPGVPKVLLGLVLVDLCIYWMHRALHASPALWRLHRFHHSAPALHWLSGLRTSVPQCALFAVPQVLIPFVLLDMNLVEAAAGFSVGKLVQFWEHANVGLRLGWLGRWVLVTPDSHRLHHAAGAAGDCNFAIIFITWDRLFGTWRPPEALGADQPLGLVEPAPVARMVLGL